MWIFLGTWAKRKEKAKRKLPKMKNPAESARRMCYRPEAEGGDSHTRWTSKEEAPSLDMKSTTCVGAMSCLKSFQQLFLCPAAYSSDSEI